MAPPTLQLPTPSRIIIHLETLTPESFAPFGTVITSPLPKDLNSVPSVIPSPRYPQRQPNPIFANQNSALKTSPISPLVKKYPDFHGFRKPKAQMNMFSCFPRTNLSGSQFQVKILERHPYTTQTFVPLGLSPSDASTCFIVIVAPTLPGSMVAASDSNQSVEVPLPPDLSQVRAFLASGDQAVTYSTGTWHAPMVVLGAKRVDFVVTQFVNGVAVDDCQEVLVGGNISVDLSKLRLRITGEAKL